MEWDENKYVNHTIVVYLLDLVNIMDVVFLQRTFFFFHLKYLGNKFQWDDFLRADFFFQHVSGQILMKERINFILNILLLNFNVIKSKSDMDQKFIIIIPIKSNKYSTTDIYKLHRAVPLV